MTIRYGWIQGTSGDVPTYSAQADRDLLATLLDEGVIRGCKASGGSPARTVIVGTGQAVIAGDDTSNGAQPYVVTVSAAETVAIGAAPGSGTRIDLVGFRVRDLAAGGPAGNDIIADVVVGTVGAGVPATPTSFLPICSVSMTAGQTAVAAGQVVDLRTFAGPKEPVGTIKMWYGPSSRVPYGWRCLTVSGTPETIGAFGSYPDLADLLGVTAGNITVANMRGRIPIGIDPADTSIDTVGELQGSRSVVLSTDNIPAHTHSMAHTHGTFTSSGQSAGHIHSVSGTANGVGMEVVQRLGSAAAGTFIAGVDADGNGVMDGTSVNGMVVNNYGDHSHSVSGTTGAGSADHTHNVNVTAFTGNTAAQTTTGAALDKTPPVVALHLLIRVL